MKANHRTILGRIIGRYRLALGFCPQCNSDAPAKYSCHVCEEIHTGTVWEKNIGQRLSPFTKQMWWRHFSQPISEPFH